MTGRVRAQMWQSGRRLRCFPAVRLMSWSASSAMWKPSPPNDFSKVTSAHQQGFLGLAQQLQAGLMGLVFDVACGQQDSGVAQQHVGGRVRR
jgi:hypothetical protein